MKEWSEHKGIPFPVVTKAINEMAYASTERVMFEILFYTGCRITELDRMKRSNLEGNKIYWKLGKNQKQHRWEYLPQKYLEELKDYWKTHRVYGDRFFGVTSATFKSYFDKQIRLSLGGVWLEKERVYGHNMHNWQFKYQVKGLRKVFQSFVFYSLWDKYKDSNVAVLMVQKRMRHKSERITAVHYIQECEHLKLQEYIGKDMEEIAKSVIEQQKLFAYGIVAPV